MSAAHIPQELLDVILHELQNDTRTLRRCALVARCFLPASQRLIFSRIYLDASASGLTTCQKLHAILLHSPHLIEYPEALHLQLRSNPHNQGNNILPDTLLTLSHLRYLRLSGSAAWESLPSVQRNAIRNVFSLPCLVSVSVAGIRRFPLAILTCYSQLTHISINDITIDTSNSAAQNHFLPYSVPTTHVGQLTALSGGEGESGAIATRTLVHCLSQPRSSLSFSSLRNFTAAVRFEEDVTAYQKVILSSRRFLQSLTLSVDCKAPAQFACIDIGPLSNLRHLRITIFENPCLSMWILHLLAGVSKINMIEEVAITVFFSNFVEAAWEEIDATLSEPKFSSLRMVSLRYWKKEHEILLPERRFPHLVSKGILFVFNEGDRVFPRNSGEPSA